LVEPSDEPKPTAGWLAEFTPASRALRLVDGPADGSPSVVESGGCRIIFDGLLHDRFELRERCGNRLAGEPSDAELVREAYELWGRDAVSRLRGNFALIIWDSARDQLLCSRDQLGIQPLFYAETGRTLLLSPSMETLLRHPGVSSDLNRAGLVDHLMGRWLRGEETYFAQIRRLPPGHVLRLERNRREIYRYWDPAPPDGPIDWIPDDQAQERFDALLEQAVGRCLASGPAAINLSGGLDSSTVAMVAADICRSRGQAAPMGLSLVFPGPDHDEAMVQRGVAAVLGLPHVQLPFEDAAGSEGTLAAALAMTRRLPAPLSVIWRPALTRLALRGTETGCRALLTGEGADEWLGVYHSVAADLFRSLDLAGVYRLWRTYARSYPSSRWRELHNTFWQFGARLLLREVLLGFSPFSRVHGALRSRADAKAAGERPWVAPDAGLRAEMARRLEENRESEKRTPRARSHYMRETRLLLDLPQKWMVHEESFLLARRIGMRFQHPFWDCDLIELLFRVRPRVLMKGGYTKSLIRDRLTHRFPRLGFERQRKSWVGGAFLSVMADQADKARQAIGRPRVLAELGVIDLEQASAFLENPLSGRGRQWLGAVWNILNLEAWTQSHFRSR